MILAIDDDSLVLDIVESILSAEGYRVVALQDARLALNLLEKEEPELIISDVMMPEMTGFDFRVAYEKKFPTRGTPFVFLSSARDTEHVVEGLNLGVDDYLTKPIITDILKAKVRSLLARNRRARGSIYRGDLTTFPFPKILSFCERQGLSGELDVTIGGQTVSVYFMAGTLVGPEGGELPDSQLEALFEATEGQFQLWSKPVNFSSVRGEQSNQQHVTPPSTPSGILSTLSIGGKAFQIQTEYVPTPDDCSVTVVMLNGKTLLKQQTEKLAGRDVDSIVACMSEQHLAVQDAIRKKLELLDNNNDAREDTIRATFDRLFDEGMTCYLEQDLEAALSFWEKAEQIDKKHELLALNMRMLRKKMGDTKTESP